MTGSRSEEHSKVRFSTPVHLLLRDRLESVCPDAALEWDRAVGFGSESALAAPRLVRVNGAWFPVPRLPWNRVADWFESVRDESNQRFFGGALPAATLAWNRRFRSLGGRIDLRRSRIELSSAHFEACGPVPLAVVLIHEQIHLSLHVEGRYAGHGQEFRARSSALGLPGIRHDMPLPRRIADRTILHRYGCGCGRIVESRRRFRVDRACAACCRLHSRGKYDSRFRLRYLGSYAADASP